MKDTVLLQISTVALIYFLGFGCDAYSGAALNSKSEPKQEIEYYFMNDCNKIYCTVKEKMYLFPLKIFLHNYLYRA